MKGDVFDSVSAIIEMTVIAPGSTMICTKPAIAEVDIFASFLVPWGAILYSVGGLYVAALGKHEHEDSGISGFIGCDPAGGLLQATARGCVS